VNPRPHSHRPTAPVFLDESGRRWRRWRRGALALGIFTSIVGGSVVLSVLVPPLIPRLATNPVKLNITPRIPTSKVERLQMEKKLELWFALERHHAPQSLRPSELPISKSANTHSPRKAGDPIIAGFFVNWDDNSTTSLREHADDLDWVVCEWGFIVPGGDSLRMKIDRRVQFTINQVIADPAQRPAVFLMVSNYDAASHKWDPASLRRLLTDRVARQRAITQLTDSVGAYGLAGVTIDFEEVPPDLTRHVVEFTRALTASLAPRGRRVTQAVSFNDNDEQLAAYSEANSYVFLMLYDEHYGRGDPGPVASQQWYVEKARHMLRFIPPSKAIFAVGAYGYDWNDGDSTTNGQTLTFQEMMSAMRNAPIKSFHFDSLTLNPYARWTDSDSTDHVAWYLDAVTAYDQILAGQALGAAGHAIWRLGSEDPAIWRSLGRRGIDAPASELEVIPPGYDPEGLPRDGKGEILQMVSRPTEGRREITYDSATRMIVGEKVVAYATPYIFNRYGDGFEHRVALTFDDGPDGRWTATILDTLKSRHAPATFFVIGQNVEAHIPLMRRIWAEGHEIGNHTFTHPNLFFTNTIQTKLQLDATQRLIEAVLGRRTAFFRPPYFGDAEPTTDDELVPVAIASDRGYLTVGVHIDSEDWRSPGVQTIIDTTLAQRWRGHVVLLHDGGGDRSQTVAALGPLIDSLRANGDTLVTVSGLMGLERAQAMPGLPNRTLIARVGEIAAFGLFGLIEWALYWIFMIAIALGVARLLFITALAVIQHARRHQDPEAVVTYAPSVSVIVPAYREEAVIVKTIASLVKQEYPGTLEVVVVDDGSPDATYDRAVEAFGSHPLVRIYKKANGGKASALNFGLTVASGEIVICLDADTIFVPNTVGELVAPLADPTVGAVAGNAKVGNRINIVTRWQAIEYVTSQNLDRRAFSLLNCITVVPGAVGAWRKDLVTAAGGFSEETLAEDQDLTLSIRRAGHAIAYADEAIGYTEAPDTLRMLSRQRFRWSFGTLQCLWKHRDVMFKKEYGSLGWIALPNVLIFQLFYPAISPIADFLFVWSIASVYWVRAQHGATFAISSLERVMTFYALFLVVDWAATLFAFMLEPDEDRSLTWLVLLQRFAYRQVMYVVVIRSLIAALKGRVVGWGNLERKATVALEPQATQRAVGAGVS
jgi:cellulose synthase/poly-beta-1,6-N-acetylglucosamine synthase-like glycosyltransferase/peptidoglycan/xylan/chitin deacetylase (PgdA/CDA1 family)/spore germination protein YaaH